MFQFTVSFSLSSIVVSQVVLHAELLHDEDTQRLSQIKRMATESIPDKELVPMTFWLRAKPASVRLWISAKEDPLTVFSEAVAVFSKRSQGDISEEKEPEDPNKTRFMSIPMTSAQ